MDIPGATPLALDITDPASVHAAAEAAADVGLLVNNAGIQLYQSLITGDLTKIRSEMDTHYFGTLNVVRAFAPTLAANGGGAILNVLSVASWVSYEGVGSYSAAKSAEWSLTNGIRLELAAQGTQVTGFHLGPADTEMLAGVDGDKLDPAVAVRMALDGLEAAALEVLADEQSEHVKAALSADPRVLYPTAAAD